MEPIQVNRVPASTTELAAFVKSEGLPAISSRVHQMMPIMNPNRPFCIPVLRELLRGLQSKAATLANFKKTDFPLKHLPIFIYTDADLDTEAGFVLEFVRFYFNDAFMAYDASRVPFQGKISEEKMNELTEIENTFAGCESLVASLIQYIERIKEEIITLSSVVLAIPNHTHNFVQAFPNGQLTPNDWHLEGVYVDESQSIKNAFVTLDHNLKLVRERTLGQQIIAICSILARDCMPILQILHWNSTHVPNHSHLLFYGDPEKNRDERTLAPDNVKTMRCGEIEYPKEANEPLHMNGLLEYCEVIRKNVALRPVDYIEPHDHMITNPIPNAMTAGVIQNRKPAPISLVGCKLIDDNLKNLDVVKVDGLKEIVLWKHNIASDFIAVSGILFKSDQGHESLLGPHIGIQSQTFTLLPEEYIKKIYINLKKRYFTHMIIHLSLITNTGREFSFGSDVLKHNYNFIAPDGYKITGFYGRSNESAILSLNPIIERTDLNTELSYSK